MISPRDNVPVTLSYAPAAQPFVTSTSFLCRYAPEMTKKNDDYTLSKSEFDKTGYWGVTKQLVDKTYADLNKDKAGTTNSSDAVLILTGHSQGGTRAALASMYMKKKYSGQPHVGTSSSGLMRVWDRGIIVEGIGECICIGWYGEASSAC